jgi:ribulose bisphosphate carboxylase small subunit
MNQLLQDQLHLALMRNLQELLAVQWRQSNTYVDDVQFRQQLWPMRQLAFHPHRQIEQPLARISNVQKLQVAQVEE